MADAEIVRASDDDVASVAGRRYADEHGRRLYRDFAEASATGAWTVHDDGTPIAMAFARASEEELFVNELFVESSFRSAGIGRKLFARLTEDAPDTARAGAIAASDPSAAAFAALSLLASMAQLHHVAGAIPREDDLVRLAAGTYRFGVRPLDVAAHGFALDALDREVRGAERRADHAYFAQRASGTAFFLDGEFVGYAYVWPSGRIGPLASSSAAYVAQMFGFALAASVRTYGSSWCTALIPATNVRTLRAALRNGLRVERSVTFLSDVTAGDFARYVAFHDLLV